MFKHPAILLGYFKYCIIPSIIALIPVFFFLRNATFTQTWLLYLGDALFLCCMIVVMLMLSRTANNDAATPSMMIAGLAITIFSIIVISVLTFILLLIFIPGILHTGNTQEGLTHTPTNMVYDKTHGLMFVLFMNAVIGTGAAGSFISVMMSSTMKRNQKGDRAEL